MDELLFQACRMFVLERGGFEQSVNQIDEDARKMAEFIERVRPARPKLDLDLTPGAITVMDDMEAYHEAWKITRIAATLAGGSLAIGAKWDPLMYVDRARDLVAQAKVRPE